jgi:hypothetical protein
MFRHRGAILRELQKYTVSILMDWVRALMVAMHVGLRDSPFVPHNLLSGGPCFFN